MRNTAKWTLAAMLASAAFGQTSASQTPDRTFYLANLNSNQDLTSLTTALRTIVDIQSLTPDAANHAIVAHGTVDQMVAAEWLIHELDIAPGSNPAPESAPYKMATPSGEIMRIFRLNSTATQATVTSLTTAIRTVADLQRLFPFHNAVIARGNADKISAAEFIFQQVTPPDGSTPTADSPLYTMPPDGPSRPAESVRVLRIASDASNATLTSAVTAIRTVADLQRLMPMEFGKAIVSKGPDNKREVAEWIVHDLIKPTHTSKTSEFTMAPDSVAPSNPGSLDNAVRIFYVTASNAQLTGLVTQIRTDAGIPRIMPMESYSAIVLRGRPDQVATAQSIIDKFAAAPAGDNPQIK